MKHYRGVILCPVFWYDHRCSKEGRSRIRTIALSMVSLLMLTACSLRQQLITGEPLVFGFDTRSGAVVDRDLLGQQDASGGTGSTTTATVPQIPHQGEIIAIVVKNVFLRYLKALASPHVLVYAEVFDVGRDPQFRTSAEYPYFWISQIEPLAGLVAESAAHRNAVAKNAAVLPTLSDLVMNLPPLRPEHEKEMSDVAGARPERIRGGPRPARSLQALGRRAPGAKHGA